MDEIIEPLKTNIISEISSWEKTNSLSILVSMLRKENNISSSGSYVAIDENDIMDIVYLIFKYSRGTKILDFKVLTTISDKLSIVRLVESKAPSTEYSLYNGSLTDIHLVYLFHMLFDKFSPTLIENYGFDESIFMIMYIFLAQNKSTLFNIAEVKKIMKNYEMENREITLKMIEKYIDYFSIEESELDLSTKNSFIKQIQQKPFIKIEKTDKFFTNYYFNRNHLISNFHYLLAENEKYKAHKGEFLEELTYYIFDFSLPESSIYKNLTYKYGEIDLLVETDTKIILVECKSGLLYNDYRLEGNTSTTKRNLDSIILKAAKQLNKGKKYIVENGNFMHQGKPLHFGEDKEILLLNVCFELPVGFANKLENSNILSLPIGDLMIIVDELRESVISDNSRTQKLDEYIKLRSKLLGFLPDSELTIMTSILYNPHFDTLLKYKDKIELNSDESLTRVNQLYALLLNALINVESEEYKLVEANYKGVLRDLMFDFNE
ncbi:NERD domain-containing protein [Marinilactibacillus piezotolerans]|uniref:NERD domain-containing protein n=1 Tax=Marinilactibacillus piezotolerans TaxID=258723 RepID=UPI0009B10142|nr:NERD domain-containing protein [Marinilactibacillus piezotolerans]